MSESIVESLRLFRSLIRNPRFFVIAGEMFSNGWSAKGVGYPLHVSAMPSFSDAELIQAVDNGKSIGLPTGRLSDGLFDFEYDLYREDALGSEANAKAWIVENVS